ncbi:c-type cytochrome [Myxococcota bacterium]|nr:c-type cytochrome [Myxococcota bacterium]
MALASSLGSSSVAADDNARGEQLYELCVQCHGENGEGDSMALAPAISGFGQWYIATQLRKFRDGGRGRHFDDIAGMRMRPMALSLRSEEDVDAVSAYAASLPDVLPEPTLEGGDPAKGQAGYAACSGCHGADGYGNEMVGAPSLHTSDWYFVKQMHNYKAGVRGTNPKDAVGAVMVGMATIVPNDQALMDLLAYLRTQQK